MNVFEAVKQYVTARQAAEYYGIRVKRNGMAVCPFHNDKNPSMKLDRRYHCFACQADGDVIDFVAQLCGLKPKEAAEKLAVDFSVICDNKYGHDPPKRKIIKQMPIPEQRYERAEKYCFRVLSDYLHLLKRWQEEYAPKPEDEKWHPYFIEALKKRTFIEYLLDLLLSEALEDRASVIVAYGKEVAELERRISEFITTDATGIIRSVGYDGTGIDGGTDTGNVRNNAEGRSEKQSA